MKRVKTHQVYNNADYGFNILNGIGGIFEECTALSNFGGNQEVAGIRLEDCTECIIKQCICSNNHNTSTTSGSFGIELLQNSATARNNQIIDCTTDGNQNNETTTAVAAGIKIGSNVTRTVVRNCRTFSNTSGSSSSYGILNDHADTNTPTIITGCIAGGNNINFGGAKPAKYAARNQLGSHGEIGKFENIALKTVGKNDVGYVTYLDASAFPLIITAPGHYIMCEDVNLSIPTQAISIQSSYVTLDMNGKEIKGTYSIGISIFANQHDIMIKNGTISDFNNHGIFSSFNCHHIDIENMKISKPSQPCNSAITFNGNASSTEIHDCTIKNCSITSITAGFSQPRVVEFNYCTDFYIYNSNFNFNGGTNTTNINLDNAKKMHFIDCTFNDCEISGEARIMNLIDADGLLVDNCIFNNNGGVDDTYIITGTTSGSIIRNSTFNNNVSTNDDLIIINLEGGQGNLIESCLISNNTAATTAPTPPDSVVGIVLDATKNKVKQCTLLSNSAPDDSYGIQIAGDDNAIIDCATIYNTAGTTGVGIQIDFSADQTLVKDCLSFNNTTTGINNEGTNSIIIGCEVGNNNPDYNGADALDFDRTGSTDPHPVFKYDNIEFIN